MLALLVLADDAALDPVLFEEELPVIPRKRLAAFIDSLFSGGGSLFSSAAADVLPSVAPEYEEGIVGLLDAVCALEVLLFNDMFKFPRSDDEQEAIELAWCGHHSRQLLPLFEAKADYAREPRTESEIDVAKLRTRLNSLGRFVRRPFYAVYNFGVRFVERLRAPFQTIVRNPRYDDFIMFFTLLNLWVLLLKATRLGEDAVVKSANFFIFFNLIETIVRLIAIGGAA